MAGKNGRPSSILTHPQGPEIEAAILSGLSIGQFSVQYPDISKQAYYRYRNSHDCGVIIAKAPPTEREIFDAQRAVDELMRIKLELQETTEALRQEKKHRDRGVMLELQAKQIERLFDMAIRVKEIQDKDFRSSDEWLETRTAILGVIDGCPRCSAKLEEVLDERAS